VADIPVKPRRSGMPWWIWVVVALAVALVAWLVLGALTRDAADDLEDERARPPATGQLLDAPGASDALPLALSQPATWR